MSKTDNTPLDVASGLDHLLTNLPAEVILLHSPGGQIHYASHSAPQIFGDKERLQGSNFLDRVHADDRDRVKSIFLDTATKSQEPIPVTIRLNRVRQEDAWVVVFSVAVKDASGRVIELHSTLRDVTQQIALRDRIVEHDKLSHMTNTLARVGGWYYNIPDKDLFWSDQVRMIFEVDADFLPTNESMRLFFSAEDAEYLRQEGLEAIATNTARIMELPMKTSRGTERWVRVVLQAAYEKGEPKRLYGATQDITEIKLREHELANVVLELTSHRDQLEEYSHIMSHHIRAPLANLTSISNLLADEPAAEEQSELHIALKEAVESLRMTFDEVSSAVRLRNTSPLKDEKVNVQELVQHVLERLEPSMRDSNATVSLNVDACPIVDYPVVYLQVIVQQLIMNAIRFSHPDRPPHIIVTTAMEMDQQVVTIRDNGAGIDLDRFGSKLFRLRSTFHRHASGRGVGLFMVRTIIESLGGEIDVESRPGEGTTFTIYLRKHRVPAL